MVVEAMVVPDQKEGDLKEFQVTGTEYAPTDGAVQNYTGTTGNLETMAAVCSLCNEAIIRYKEGAYVRVGEPTEAALKCLVEKMGMPGNAAPTSDAERTSYYGDIISSRYEVEATLEFCRNRKSMSVLCRSKASGERHLLVKGAAELLLERCTKIIVPTALLPPSLLLTDPILRHELLTCPNAPSGLLGWQSKLACQPFPSSLPSC